jgi:hypothetical protein
MGFKIQVENEKEVDALKFNTNHGEAVHPKIEEVEEDHSKQ